MVDFRPLLFINALAIMLLVTAGFASVRNTPHPEAMTTSVTAPTATDAQTPRFEPPANQAAKVPPASQDFPAGSDPGIATATAKTSATSPATELPATGNPNALPEFKVEPLQVAMADPVSKLPEPKPAPPEPPTTGTLTLRSNVVDDHVLINGEPQGSTRLDLDLKPGRYDIEITKDGFKSWQQVVNVDAGDHRTLQGRLEAYTRVDYRAGTWIGGVKTGDGTYNGRDGLRYEGAFVDGKFHGKGTAWYPDGGRYDGDWQQGLRDGEGTYRGADDATYTGQFGNDQFNGQGTLTRANGDILTGHWVDNRLNGHGSLTSADGMLYVGGFRSDRFHGEGSLTYPDGRYYEGDFSNGEFHGKGSEVLASGKKYQGEYLEGKFHGKGLLLNPNGSSIEATFRHGQPYGQVILTTPQGEVFNARTSEPGVCYRDNSYRATQCPPLDGW